MSLGEVGESFGALGALTFGVLTAVEPQGRSLDLLGTSTGGRGEMVRGTAGGSGTAGVLGLASPGVPGLWNRTMLLAVPGGSTTGAAGVRSGSCRSVG